MRWQWTLLRWVWALLRWARRSVTLLIILALLVTNVLAFASSAFVAAVSGVAELAGLRTVQARQAVARRAVVKRIGRRTALSVKRSLGETVAQSLPFVGVAAVVGLTAWEIKDACDTMEDLAALDPSAAEDSDTVCGLTPPTVAEVYHEVGARTGEWSGAAWRWAASHWTPDAPPPAP